MMIITKGAEGSAENGQALHAFTSGAFDSALWSPEGLTQKKCLPHEFMSESCDR
ncbi:hypothetical protein RIEGSTA812A_PEG_1136 [invertebrate metagenome]|uniref:Uncharacterized protein n=1 Tax=invertebrate metagenome TaxID=1711999 RepID=A0A484H9Z3_9ZZZZ